MRPIREIEAELAAAREVAEAERLAVRNATVPVWQFTILPTKSDSFGGDEIWDDTIRAYRLAGEVINRDECLAAGHSEHSLGKGAMRYLFNTVTGKLIGATGGGTIYLSNGFGRKDTSAQDMAIHRINMFLAENPEGGDISQIITEFRESTRA
jgi:hypothetical protein